MSGGCVWVTNMTESLMCVVSPVSECDIDCIYVGSE